MKKFLIALPLVLIMILSMIPVMAANVNVPVTISYHSKPAHEAADKIKTETRIISVDEKVATDKAALEKAALAEIKSWGFPKLGAKVEPEWAVDLVVQEAIPASENPVNYSVTTVEATNIPGLIITAAPEGDQNINEEGKKAIQAAIDKGEKQVALAAEHLSATEVKGLYVVVKEKVDPKNAEITATAYPKCIVDPTSKETAVCAALCSEIKVQIEDVFNKVILKDFTRVFKVDKNKYPSFEAIFKTYMAQFFPVNNYQIVNTWYGQPWVEIPGVLPTQIDKDCTITLKVIPLLQKVNVIHVLNDCCTSPDGQVSKRVWKKFVEQGVAVDFIKYHTELLIDNAKAAEFAQTRLQKINALDFVFVGAKFNDGIHLDGYMTGEVYDLNGNKVATIKNDLLPTITLIYDRAECAEEKVDNATVGNTNTNTTNAPATAAGTQLPATGAKDVTAFFMSAVALLGLGIFFAKKH